MPRSSHDASGHSATEGTGNKVAKRFTAKQSPRRHRKRTETKEVTCSWGTFLITIVPHGDVVAPLSVRLRRPSTRGRDIPFDTSQLLG